MSNIYELVKAENDAAQAWQDACDVARTRYSELTEAERLVNEARKEIK